ncbi:Uncharacterised protein [Raoultella planticola]|uniref:Uncharacterized protein n=1 Tax=Raoultella planticola TaxID=575 RepID=A0A485C9B1_RAOPL|nr:Uncharacterised protein [Raoultella planticola]
MRLYLGSVIINRLPFCRQSGEICLCDAQAYRLIDDDSRHIKMASSRILRQIFAHHQTKVQRDAFVFVNHQLRFNQRGELLANFVKLFVFQIRRELPVTSFITQRHLFIAHIQQTIALA